MNALAWSLVHFLWQGAAIAALAAALMFAFKSPSTRYLVGVGALALLSTAYSSTAVLINSLRFFSSLRAASSARSSKPSGNSTRMRSLRGRLRAAFRA